MPFDWVFSSPVMVRDCLHDDFRCFLDPREYLPLGKRGAGEFSTDDAAFCPLNVQGAGAGHARYSDLRLPGRWRGFTFLHHDPSRKRQVSK